MATGLEGLRVLELGGGVSAPMAAKLMGDLGATVVKVEPPEGERSRRRGPFPPTGPHPEASGTFLFLNTNKRSVALELTEEAGQAALGKLVAQTDILVHNLPRREMELVGLDFERFAALNPALVMLSITPFGLTGPHADWLGEDLNLVHGGGWGWMCPGGGTPRERPPIKPFGQHALMQAGTHGAFAAMAGYLGALASGVGEHIDLSVQEVITSIVGRPPISWEYQGKVESRLAIKSLAPNGFYDCKDGKVFLFTSEEDQWSRMKALMGNPEWAEFEGFATRESRAAHEDRLKKHLVPWVAQRNAEDLFTACQERRICTTQVYTYPRLVEHAHLQERDFVADQEHPVAGRITMPGAPYRLKRPWWRLRSPAPRLGEGNADLARLFAAGGKRRPAGERPAEGEAQPPLPLAGVRVLDFTWVWAGPYAALQLAHLGAEVLKIESATRPDRMRRALMVPEGMAPGLNRSGMFNHLGQGKRSVALKLSHPEGRELAKQLARHCDVALSNFGTGVMERFGLGADDLLKINPDLVIAAISGFGQTGPLKSYMGYGGPIVALSGVSAQTGYGPGAPSEVGIAYGDPNAGAYTAFAVAAGLAARRFHGGGQFIDVSLWEAMMVTGFEGWLNFALGNSPHQPMANRDPCWAPHNLYPCAGDDDWISLAVSEEAHWQGLCRAMGRPELAADPRFAGMEARKNHEDDLDALIAAWSSTQPRWALAETLQAAGVPAFPSVTGKDLVEDPHLAARGFFRRLPHAEVGERALPGTPWRLTRRPDGVRAAAPLIGSSTDDVLQNLLGIPEPEVRRLWREGVLG